jgi:hypothetical protein
MTNLGKQLRDGDPLADAPSLLPREVQRIRQAVIVEVSRPSAVWWPPPAVVAATVAATLAIGVAIGRSLSHQTPVSPGLVERTEGVEPARRQVQFATPGGTRIIWVIDPDFDL